MSVQLLANVLILQSFLVASKTSILTAFHWPNSTASVCSLNRSCVGRKSVYMDSLEHVDVNDTAVIADRLSKFVGLAHVRLKSMTFSELSLAEFVTLHGGEPPALKSISASKTDWFTVLHNVLRCFTSHAKAHKQLLIGDKFRPDIQVQSHSNQTAATHLPGVSLFMNCWSVRKHFGHFAMKALEALWFISTSVIPSVDNIIFHDYPVLPLTSWESFVWTLILEQLPSQCVDVYSVQHRPAARLCLVQNGVRVLDIDNVILDYGCADHMFLSPHYQNPFPAGIASLPIWQMSLTRFLGPQYSKLINTTCPSPVAVILQRSDGTALRRFLNLDGVVRVVKRAFPKLHVVVAAMSADMDVKDQALIFANASLIVSTHSSQIWNLIFARPDTAIIEIQAVPFHTEFREYATMVNNTNYHYIRNPAENVVLFQSAAGGEFTKTSVPTINSDFYVDLAMLQNVTNVIKATLPCLV